jgi:hypothetical protein
MDNVIQFPKSNVSGKFIPTDESQIEDRMLYLKHHHINETLANVIPMLFTQLEAAAFDFGIDEDDSGDAYLKDGAFVVEAVRALLCRYHGLEHPFRELSDAVFTPDGAPEGGLKVVDSLNITFKNPELEKGNS